MTEFKVEELTPEDDEVEITGTITELPTPRAVSTRYGQKKITTCTFEDDTGNIDLTLWEEEIDAIEEGANVKITGAYVREWAEDVQLNISRDGNIEQVDGAATDASEEETGEVEAETEEEVEEETEESGDEEETEE